MKENNTIALWLQLVDAPKEVRDAVDPQESRPLRFVALVPEKLVEIFIEQLLDHFDRRYLRRCGVAGNGDVILAASAPA